jgi:putative aldouronate transport system permease protein
MVNRRGFGSTVFETCNVSFFVLLSIVMVLPIWNVLMVSLVGMGEFFSRPLILWPRNPTLASYMFIFGQKGDILNAFVSTVALTVVGTLYSLTVTTLLSYGLSKKWLPARGFFLTLITVTMFFGGGLIPYYLLIRRMGLMDHFMVLFIPSAVNTWNFIVIKSFFSQLPAELEESARIDGANDLVIFTRIVLPLSKPTLATFALFYAVGYWNSWWPATLFIVHNTQYYTLQYMLRSMLLSNVRPALMDAAARRMGLDPSALFDEGIKMGVVIIATVPILCVYPFLQKYFTKGVMIGSIKG